MFLMPSEKNRYMSLEAEREVPWWIRVIVGRRPSRTLLRVVLLVIGAMIVFKFILLPIRVIGQSMAPTYNNGRPNLVNRLAYLGSNPRRGDVVSLRIIGERHMWLKRVIGLPGDRILLQGDRVWINGEPLEEPYVVFPGRFRPQQRFVVEPHHYFVIGDNRDVTEYRQIMVWQIVGKVLF